MGDRGNVLVREDDKDSGVYLYTHWRGSDLPILVQEALLKRVRWDDCPYLTRIIFDVLSQESHGDETGFGISSMIGDGEYRLVTIDCKTQTVYIGSNDNPERLSWKFEGYIVLEASDLAKVWA